MSRAPGGSFAERPKSSACTALGRICVRRPGHYCRARRLWVLRTQAYAPPARNCQRIAWAECIQRRSRNGAPWSPLPLCHRIWCGCYLRLCKPRHSFLDTTRFRVRRSIWRGRLFLHESHCVTALRCRPSGFFLQVNDRRRGHSHLLRRASHISHRMQIFAVISF